MPYQLFKAVMLNPGTTIYDFCEEYEISESQFRRKVQAINQALKPFDLQVRLINQIQLVGDPVMIRCFIFYFLSMVHRQFSRVTWIENNLSYRKQTKEILSYLNLEQIEMQIETVSFIVYAIDYARKMEIPMSFDQKTLLLLSYISGPEQPEFLSHWTMEEWQLLIIIIYSVHLVDIELPLNYKGLTAILQSSDARNWMDAFERFFFVMSGPQKQYIYDQLMRFHFAHQVLRINEDVFETYSSESFEQIQTLFPYYVTVFESFWEYFSTLSPAYNDGFAKYRSLSTCNILVPLSSFLPTIYFYLDMSYASMSENLLKEWLKLSLRNRCFTEFVSSSEAEIIITNSSLAHFDILTQRKVIPIQSNFSLNDLTNIQNKVEELIQFKNRRSL